MMGSTVAKGLCRDSIDKARSVYGVQAFFFFWFSFFLCPRVKSASFPASKPPAPAYMWAPTAFGAADAGDAVALSAYGFFGLLGCRKRETHVTVL